MERLLLSWKQSDGSKGVETDRGIALMLVLWVLALLSIMVFEFCYTMRIEATIPTILPRQVLIEHSSN
jgi:hypothetical protein